MRTLTLTWKFLCLSFLFFNFAGQAATIICSRAIVDQQGAILGWSLAQPTQEARARSNYFPRRLSIAFSKDDTLFVSDERTTVAVDPIQPRQIRYNGVGETRFLHVNSAESIFATGNGLNEIREIALNPNDDSDVFTQYRIKATIPVEGHPQRTPYKILGYSNAPQRLAYWMKSVDDDKKDFVVVLQRKQEGFEFQYEVAIPSVPTSGAPLYVGFNSDLTKVYVAEVTPDEVKLAAHGTDRSVSPTKRRVPHREVEEIRGEGGLENIVIAPNGDTFLVGSMLIHHPFVEKKEPELTELSANLTPIRAAAFSPDSHYLAYQEYNRGQSGPLPLLFYNAFTRRPIHEISLDELVRVSQIAFSPSGDYFAVAGYSHYPRNSMNRALLQVFKTINVRESTRVPFDND